MLSRAQIKHIRSLALQKYRLLHQSYVVEGPKLVAEWLTANAPLRLLAATPEWQSAHEEILSKRKDVAVVTASEEQLADAGTLKSTQGVLAVAAMPKETALPEALHGWTILLDNVQDPGNVGAIIRIADWFGISQVIASAGSASFYNPKVLQAAMGGHLRVPLYVAEPATVLSSQNHLATVATTLQGENAFRFTFPAAGILVIGNESKGMDPETAALCRHRLFIPRFGGAESLNAAVAAGVFCALLKKG